MNKNMTEVRGNVAPLQMANRQSAMDYQTRVQGSIAETLAAARADAAEQYLSQHQEQNRMGLRSNSSNENAGFKPENEQNFLQDRLKDRLSHLKQVNT